MKTDNKKNLLIYNSVLKREWHPSKNKDLQIKNITLGMRKKVWWKCEKGHEWQAVIKNRSYNNTGCPYCSGRKASTNNCLAKANPELVKEWHKTKNNDLTPDDVTPNSGKKVYWICKKGHEWQSVVKDRNKGSGCPYCAGKKINNENSLATLNPALASEWNYKRNLKFNPNNIALNSNKKVWWICEKGHEWQANVLTRNYGTGCPYCAGQKVCTDNCLATVNPKLAKQWHPTKNELLTPKDVVAGSQQYAWWKCTKGHEWKAIIKTRHIGAGCPYCSGNKVCKDNCLATLNPIISKEWHPTKNEPLTPYDVTTGSTKKVWWVCKRGHEWKTAVITRTYGSNCPKCNSQTSQKELRIYSELKVLFKNVKLRKKINNIECDIFLENHNIGIEYDGVYWHKNKVIKDKEKNIALSKLNIDLIRVREKGLIKINRNNVVDNHNKNEAILIINILKKIIKIDKLSQSELININQYISQKKLINNKEYMDLLIMLPGPLPGKSLKELNPALAKEWHKTKNGKLFPSDVSAGSHKKIWWICRKGHEWQATIKTRFNGNNCPYCAGKKICIDNCLKTINPKLSLEWHPAKNKILTPNDVGYGSDKKVWWICSKGHEWKAMIYNRHKGAGCPYCSGKKTNKENSLATINPFLSKEWHPTKNLPLTPEDVTANSAKKVWWVCNKGHEWQTNIGSRNKGTGCPKCKYVTNKNRLSLINPFISKDWNYNKNNDLTPDIVTVNSNKKVWWICSKGHEWQATISSRNRGNGCPSCYNKKRKK